MKWAISWVPSPEVMPMMEARFCILWFICMYLIVREICISSTVRHGRISSLISGILLVADMWTWERA